MRSGEDDEAKNFEDSYVTFREMRQSRYSSRPHLLREKEPVTATSENLLSRFYCSPAEACRRSGEDDEAKNFENLYFRFGEKEAFICQPCASLPSRRPMRYVAGLPRKSTNTILLRAR